MTILGIDLGTSGVKAAVFDATGRVLGSGFESYPTSQPEATWSEQDPGQWWSALVSAITAAGADAEVEVIGFSGHMQDLICLDSDQQVIRPAILYSDVRAGDATADLHRKLPDWLGVTGNEQDASNVAAKIVWLRQHEPQVLQRTHTILLGAPGYAVLRAGGDATCDVTTASTTGLLDGMAREWASSVLAAVGLSKELLPRLDDQPSVAGHLGAGAAAELGLRPGIPLVHGMGDAGSTTDGFVGLEAGSAYAYLGTSGWIASVQPADPNHRPGPVHSLILPGWDRRLRIGAVMSAGGAAEWARHVHLGGRAYAEVDDSCEQRLARVGTQGVPLCLPSLHGARTPIRDSNVRGTVVGINESTTAEDLYLAVLLGVAIDLRLATDAMGARPQSLPVIGGGASSPVWRQLLADAFDVEVLSTEADVDLVGARSAASSAAVAVGVPTSFRPLFDRGEAIRRTLPRAPVSTERLQLHLGLYQSLAPTFAALNQSPQR